MVSRAEKKAQLKARREAALRAERSMPTDTYDALGEQGEQKAGRGKKRQRSTGEVGSTKPRLLDPNESNGAEDAVNRRRGPFGKNGHLREAVAYVASGWAQGDGKDRVRYEPANHRPLFCRLCNIQVLAFLRLSSTFS